MCQKRCYIFAVLFSYNSSLESCQKANSNFLTIDFNEAAHTGYRQSHIRHVGKFASNETLHSFGFNIQDLLAVYFGTSQDARWQPH